MLLTVFSHVNADAAGFIISSDLGFYRSGVSQRVIAACSGLPNYKKAIVAMSLDPFGKIVSCEVVQSTGASRIDQKIVDAIQKQRFPIMVFANSKMGRMKLRIVLSNTVSSNGDLIVRDGEEFSYVEGPELKLEVDCTGEKAALNLLDGESDRSFDREIEQLFAKNYLSWVEFNSPPEGSENIEKLAENDLKSENYGAAAKDFLLATYQKLNQGETGLESGKALLEKAFNSSEKSKKEERAKFFEQLSSAAQKLSQVLQSPAAELCARKAITFDDIQPVAYPTLFKDLGIILNSSLSKHDFVESEITAKRMISVANLVSVPDSGELCEAYRALSSVYMRQQKDAELKETEIAAIAALTSKYGPDNWDLVEPLRNIIFLEAKNQKESCRLNVEQLERILISGQPRSERLYLPFPDPQKFEVFLDTANSLTTNSKSFQNEALSEELMKAVLKSDLSTRSYAAGNDNTLSSLCRLLEKRGKIAECIRLSETAKNFLVRCYAWSPYLDGRIDGIIQTEIVALKKTSDTKRVSDLEAELLSRKSIKLALDIGRLERKIAKPPGKSSEDSLDDEKLKLILLLIDSPASLKRANNLFSELLASPKFQTPLNYRTVNLLLECANKAFFVDHEPPDSALVEKAYLSVDAALGSTADLAPSQIWSLASRCKNVEERKRVTSLLELVLGHRRTLRKNASGELVYLQVLKFLENSPANTKKNEDLEKRITAATEAKFGQHSQQMIRQLLEEGISAVKNRDFETAEFCYKKSTLLSSDETLKPNDYESWSSELGNLGCAYLETGKTRECSELIFASCDKSHWTDDCNQTCLPAFISTCRNSNKIEFASRTIRELLAQEEKRSSSESVRLNSLKLLLSETLLEQAVASRSHVISKRSIKESDECFDSVVNSVKKDHLLKPATISNSAIKRSFLLAALGVMVEAKRLEANYGCKTSTYRYTFRN